MHNFDLRTMKINPRLSHVLRVNGSKLLIHVHATPREREAMRFWAEDKFHGCSKCGRPLKRLFAITATGDFNPEWETAEILPMFAARQCECPEGRTYLSKIRGATLSQILKMGENYWDERHPDDWIKHRFESRKEMPEKLAEDFRVKYAGSAVAPEDVPF